MASASRAHSAGGQGGNMPEKSLRALPTNNPVIPAPVRAWSHPHCGKSSTNEASSEEQQGAEVRRRPCVSGTHRPKHSHSLSSKPGTFPGAAKARVQAHSFRYEL